MSDYAGESVDLEVARYGLRTFQAIRASEAKADPMRLLTFPTLFWDLFGGRDPFEDDPSDPLTLCSVSAPGSHWTDGTCKAECIEMGGFNVSAFVALLSGEEIVAHEAPHETCDCGIYATLSLEHLNRQYPHNAQNMVAVVAAEGQTLIGDRGFRTQYARVVAYWCDDRLAAPAKRQFRDAQRYMVMSSMLRDFNIHDNDPIRDEERASTFAEGPSRSYGLGMYS